MLCSDITPTSGERDTIITIILIVVIVIIIVMIAIASTMLIPCIRSGRGGLTIRVGI